ncbi:hypothetical protein EIP91_011410 [Steccherinum ochraceum]|uniref:Uncharacterized protein n=1 Tax=Steccherinum ochraceum TaxID=92696 RepID=A0A4V2MUT6_9APHY|nr:hypothetical protein EIP91_011410 [Steccherinum ochraceum]
MLTEKIRGYGDEAEGMLATLSLVERDAFAQNEDLRSRECLRQEFARLQRALSSSLRTTRAIQNSLCSINRLPEDIFVLILKLVQDDAVGVGPFPTYESAFASELTDEPRSWNTWDHWIRLLHVCRRWRHIMLRNAFLWRTVILDGSVRPIEKLLDFFLARAGSGALRVFVVMDEEDEDYEYPDSLIALSCQMHRIQELRIRCQPLVILPDLRDPAPLLENLDITYTYQTVRGLDETGLKVDLPLLFGEQSPHLCRLTLRNVTSLDNFQFKDLTHLCLEGLQNDYRADSLNYADLLNLLNANFDLQVLFIHTLSCWIDEEISYPVDLDHDVELPFLKRLFLSGSSGQVSRLLSDLMLPRGLCMQIELTYQSEDENGVFDFLPDPHTKLFNLEDISSLEVDLSAGPLDTLQHKINAVGPSGSFRVIAVPEVATGRPLQQPTILESSLNLRDFSLDSFSSLTELWVTCPNGPHSTQTRPDWSLSFNSLPLLEMLVVIGKAPSVVDILMALATCPPLSTLQTLWIGCPPTEYIANVIRSCIRQHTSICQVTIRSSDEAPGGTEEWETLAVLGEAVDDVEVVDDFPTKGIDLPPWAYETLSRDGRIWWNAWRD